MLNLKLFLLLVLVSMGVRSWSETIEFHNIYTFAYTEFDLTDENGRYLYLDDPINEYKHISSWRTSERSLSPDSIDVILVASNKQAMAEIIVVQFEVYEKVGPLVSSEKFGVTNFDAGKAAAIWSSKPVLVRTVEYPIAGKKKFSIVFSDIPVKEIALQRWKDGLWAYELKFSIKQLCADCVSNEVINKTIVLFSKD